MAEKGVNSIRENNMPLHKIPFPNNMGVIRYILAFAVVFSHFNSMTGSSITFPVSSYTAVGGFFALSGFLMYASYYKSRDWKGYIKARARRLLPAYWLIVIAAALLLSMLSTLSPGEYFLSSGFWKYLLANLSFMNFLEPTLPGVFDNCVIPGVNASLWTMKVEWALYLTVPLLFGAMRRWKGNPLLWLPCIIIFAICYRLFFSHLYHITGNGLYQMLGRQFLGQMSYFYAGALCYFLLPTFLRYKWLILMVSCVIIGVSGYLPHYEILFQPIVVSVLVIWLSMVGKWGTWEGKRDNISYNIYLCHFPVIQSYVTLTQGSSLSSVGGLLICLVIIMIISFLMLIWEKYARGRLCSS